MGLTKAAEVQSWASVVHGRRLRDMERYKDGRYVSRIIEGNQDMDKWKGNTSETQAVSGGYNPVRTREMYGVVV